MSLRETLIKCADVVASPAILVVEALKALGKVALGSVEGFVKDVVAFFGLPKDVKTTIGKQFLQDAGNIYRNKAAQVAVSAGSVLSHIAKRVKGK